MKDFALVFRQPPVDTKNFSPKDLDSIIKKWHDWIEELGAQGKFKGQNTRLAQEGKVLKAGGVVTDGPFVEMREILGGILIVHAADIEEATTLAHGCPALDRGGSVEIRPIYVNE